MAYESLPGVFSNLIDGNLNVSSVNDNPIVAILGTSPSGDTGELYVVNNVSTAASAFGKEDGTLVRGLYEAVAGGAENIRLYRLGATAAKLEHVGTVLASSDAGITIETVSKDLNSGYDYKISWDASEGRLWVYRTSDDLLVYDNNPTYPSAAIDLQEVSVSGIGTAASDDIGMSGTTPAPVTFLAAVTDDSNGQVEYTAGTDGITLSRMKLFEELYKAYKLLENEDIDFIVPMNAYLDDKNVCDMTTTEVTALNPSSVSCPWYTTSTYPTAGTYYDALGEVFVQEYEGEYYFWWDMDRDNVAEIYPSVGSATATTDAYGDGIGAADFHEANFGYQLADFCYNKSQNNEEILGVIGVLPPNSWSLKDINNWIGKAPEYAEDSNGNNIISTNGSGLLGLKWTAGRVAGSGTTAGLPAHTINSLGGLLNGGFIATDSSWPDGVQQKDANNALIDIGKYISINVAQCIFNNRTNVNSYVASASAHYAGFVVSLPPNSAPTNKIMPGVLLPFRIAINKLDALATRRYVAYQRKSKGIVCSDAPTGSRAISDYNRLTTIRIVKATIDAIRAAAEPFLGEVLSGAKMAALDTAIQKTLGKLQNDGYLQRFEAALSATAQDKVNGKANVELVLVPEWELRQLTLNIALAAQ